MVEIRVRYVRRPVAPNHDAAVSESADCGKRQTVALTVARPEAPTLADEPVQRPTSRTGVYDLSVNILDTAVTGLTSVEVREASEHPTLAKLHLNGPRGASVIQVEVGQATSLSVHIGKPLDVSARPIDAVASPALPRPTDPSAPLDARRDPVGGVSSDGAGEQPDLSPDSVTPDLRRPTPVDVPEQFRRAFGA